jgi:hypothetical protein
MTTCADRQITVRVEQEHIDRGERKQSSCCAVALAIKEQVPGVVDVEVDCVICFQTDDGESYSMTASEEVSKFIDDFDNCQPVEPFQFKIDLEECRYVEEEYEDDEDCEDEE